MVREHLLKSWSAFTGMPWDIQQDIILLRPISTIQRQKRSENGFRLNSIEKYRGLFSAPRPYIHSGYSGYWELSAPWADPLLERPDLRFNRTHHEWRTGRPGLCPGGCGDCKMCNQERPSDEEVKIYNEQSNWSDIEILNHIRSVSCPVLGSFSATKEQDKLFSDMIDDIIYEIERLEDCESGKPCNLLWYPTIGGPGYIQIALEI